MAKQFLANRSGQNPTLDEVPNETIKIYPTEADLDADLANLEENEIVATDEDNNPASGTQYPIDVVQDGNMNAVTSNAVAKHAVQVVKWHTANIGTYTVSAGQTISPNIESYSKPIPQGYTRISLLYTVGQNYFTCSINFSGDQMYATIRNNHTAALTATFMLYQIFIPLEGLIE